MVYSECSTCRERECRGCAKYAAVRARIISSKGIRSNERRKIQIMVNFRSTLLEEVVTRRQIGRIRIRELTTDEGGSGGIHVGREISE